MFGVLKMLKWQSGDVLIITNIILKTDKDIIFSKYML